MQLKLASTFSRNRFRHGWLGEALTEAHRAAARPCLSSFLCRLDWLHALLSGRFRSWGGRFWSRGRLRRRGFRHKGRGRLFRFCVRWRWAFKAERGRRRRLRLLFLFFPLWRWRQWLCAAWRLLFFLPRHPAVTLAG